MGIEQVVVPVAGPAAAASGALADLLGDAFAAARDAALWLEPGGAVLLHCELTQACEPEGACGPAEDGAALVGALTSLCRTLAREAAPRGVRVNAIVARPRADVARLVEFLGSRASAMCTGTVLEAI